MKVICLLQARTFWFIAAVFLSTAVRSEPCPQLRTAWQRQISFSKVEHELQHDAIVAAESMASFLERHGRRLTMSHSVYLFTFASGLRAVVKPRHATAVAEVAAYRLSLQVQSPLVPPTVKRKLHRDELLAFNLTAQQLADLTMEPASLQFFVESPFDLPAMTKAERESLWSQISDEQKAERILFIFIFGQWDLHWGNVVIDESPSLALIDNENIRGRIRVKYGDLPYRNSIPVKPERQTNGLYVPFPFESAQLLVRPEREDLWNIVKDDVTEDAFENFWKWHTGKMDRTLKIVKWSGIFWIQSIGFSNYGPLVLTTRPRPEVLLAYQRLSLPILRRILPGPPFSNQQLLEILERRDQVFANGLHF